MKRSRFSDSQIMAIFKQHEAGASAPDLCREHGMSSANFYKWHTKFGGMDASLMKRMQELEGKNRRLKKMYAEERLKADIAKEIIEKVIEPAQRRELAKTVRTEYQVSIRIACDVLSISATCFAYQTQLSDENAVIAD